MTQTGRGGRKPGFSQKIKAGSGVPSWNFPSSPEIISPWWFPPLLYAGTRCGDCGTCFGLSFDFDCLAGTILQSDNAATPPPDDFCIA